MPRYVAFLRGVSPQNLKMGDLKASMERSGFSNVRTVLSSGNVAFDSSLASAPQLEQRIESMLLSDFGRAFHTIVRLRSELVAFVASDPFSPFGLLEGEKPVVTFSREFGDRSHDLPIEHGGARILRVGLREALTVYVPQPKGAVFMELIRRTFGEDVTTRTFETVKRCSRA